MVVVNDVAADLTIMGGEVSEDSPMDPVTSSLEFEVGGTATLGAIATNALGLIVGEVPASWSSSDPAVAEVSSSGVVTAKGSGAADVTAEYGDVSASLAVVVKEAKGTD